MKKLINYFTKRKDQKLRQWCVLMVVKNNSYPSQLTNEQKADSLFQYIKSGLPQ